MHQQLESTSLSPTVQDEAIAVGKLGAGPQVLTDAELAHLKEFGYVAINEIASQKDVAEIRRVLEVLFNTKAGYEEGAHFNFAGPDDDPNAPSIPQIISPHNYAKSLTKTEYYKKAFAIARQILGPEVRFGSDHTLMKPAINGPATPWHQDEAFRNPSYDYSEINIWMPLQAVNELNGCMEFIPSSHLGEILPHRSPNNDPRIHGLECYDGFDRDQAVPCPIPAGGCTIHTGRTLHSAGPNRSNGPRFAYVLNFAIPPVPAKTPRSFPWLKEKNTARLQRMQAWLRRGGFIVETWRLLKNTELRDYGSMIAKLKRKVFVLMSMLRNKKAANAPNEPAK